MTDGKWHHVVLSTASDSQALYLDDALVASQTGTAAMSVQTNQYVGAGFIGGDSPDESHASTTSNIGYATYFKGSLRRGRRPPLPAGRGGRRPSSGRPRTPAGLLPVETVKVTSPANATLTYTYDVDNGNRALTETDGLGNKTSFGYDSAGFEHTVTDPNGSMNITGHDVRGNIVSSTACQDESAKRVLDRVLHVLPGRHHGPADDDRPAQRPAADQSATAVRRRRPTTPT